MEREDITKLLENAKKDVPISAMGSFCKGVEAGAIIGCQMLLDKACEWLLQQEEMIGVSFHEDFIERFKQAMEE